MCVRVQADSLAKAAEDTRLAKQVVADTIPPSEAAAVQVPADQKGFEEFQSTSAADQRAAADKAAVAEFMRNLQGLK